MNRRALATTFGIGVVGLTFLSLRPEGREEHRQLLLDQFHLSPDANFVAFRSGYGDYRRSTQGRDAYIEGIVQFSPAEYADYVASLDDPAVWRLVPSEIDGLRLQAEPGEGAFRWWPGHEAVIRDRRQGLFWVSWGYIHSRADDGEPDVNHVRHPRSFCFGVTGRDADQRVDPCTAFDPRERPEIYVRGMLDDDDQRLFMYVP